MNVLCNVWLFDFGKPMTEGRPIAAGPAVREGVFSRMQRLHPGRNRMSVNTADIGCDPAGYAANRPVGSDGLMNRMEGEERGSLLWTCLQCAAQRPDVALGWNG